ncbi:MAG TPA: hypothetical protein VHK01_01930 [Lacipirellulaceae bacterium]|jgi:hypothetical protein|nr:hypothetical protein [Lacipirellulaceae bacterium]
MVKHRRHYVLLTLIALLVCTLRLPAANLAEQARSLRMVPADAAVYSVSLRIKEQLDIFLDSEAFDRLMAIPVIQLVKGQVTFQWQQAAIPQIKPVKDYFDSADGQETIALLKEMFSEEMFLYGGSDVAGALDLFMELNALRRTARLEAMASGEDPDEATNARLMEVLEQHAEEFKVPSIAFGWRIKDGKRAERKLDELHSELRNLLEEQRPELSPHLQREQVGGNEFLTLRLDGSMIPWDQLREEADEDDLAQIEQWQPIISEKKLVAAIGIVGDFVLLSLGDSTDHLEKMGQGDALAGNQALKRLEKHADQRVVSIGYVSKELAQGISSPDRTIDDMAGAAEEILSAAEVPAEDSEALVEDIRSLGNEFKKYMPEPSETASIAFLTSRGYEGFQYQTSPRPMADSSKPLTILNHVGGSPMLFAATRTKESPRDYEAMVEAFKRIAQRVEKIAESKAEPDDWAEYQEIRERALPLLRRWDRATREHLVPALQDGQSALVMDTSAESKRWFRQMPESPKPLPMLEFAIIAGVSDADELRKAWTEYFDIAGEAIEILREVNPDDVPEFTLSEPEERELDGGGTAYVYNFPEEWGVDSQVAVNAGLTNSVAAISVMPGTTERLLRKSELEVDTSLDLNRPAAVVSYFNFEEFIDLFRPWIDYGFDVAIGKLKVEEEDEDDGDDEDEQPEPPSPVMLQAGFFIPQLQQLLDVASALRSFSMVSYEENGVWVTHSETHFEDLE